MRFKDLKTGIILETENDFVIAQYKKYIERYKEIKPEKPRKTKSAETADEE